MSDAAPLLFPSSSLDPPTKWVEEIDGRPEEIVEVGFEAGVGQGRDQGVEHVGDDAGDAEPFEADEGRPVLKGRQPSWSRGGVRSVGGCDV